MAMGSVASMAAHAGAEGRPLFVLWLDAHSDFHTPDTTTSGNLHGTPLAYATGRKGFPGFPKVTAPVPEENICIIGLRSVDPAEKRALQESPVRAIDMRQIDESGIARPLREFLEAVEAANGMLHVSLDVDFLDPAIAPATGTPSRARTRHSGKGSPEACTIASACRATSAPGPTQRRPVSDVSTPRKLTPVPFRSARLPLHLAKKLPPEAPALAAPA